MSLPASATPASRDGRPPLRQRVFDRRGNVPWSPPFMVSVFASVALAVAIVYSPAVSAARLPLRLPVRAPSPLLRHRPPLHARHPRVRVPLHPQYLQDPAQP